MDSKTDVIASGADGVLTYDEIMERCRIMARSKVAEVTEVNLPFLDTEYGRTIFEEQIYGILLQMLSFVGANMHKSRKARQLQGIEAAKAAGVQLGRRRKYDPMEHIEVFRQLERGEISADEAMRTVGACKSTFDKMHRELRKKGLL